MESERIVLTPDDAHAIAHALEYGIDQQHMSDAQLIAADLVVQKLLNSAGFGRDVVIVLDLP